MYRPGYSLESGWPLITEKISRQTDAAEKFFA